MSRLLSHWLVAISLIFNTKIVKSKGVLKLTFNDYNNPGKGDYDGGCCDPILCGGCETYFEICLQSSYIPVHSTKNCMVNVSTKHHKGDSFNFKKVYGTFFGINNERNPLVYNFDNNWKGTFSILMKIWDDDSGRIFNVGGQRDLIDNVYGSFRKLVAGRYSHQAKVFLRTLTGSRKGSGVKPPTTTTITLSLQCHQYYYNGYCSRYCKAQYSIAAGHYTCDAYGRKICRKGWLGTDCKTPLCNKNCNNGRCSRPGKCKCHAHWTGDTCDKCIKKRGCLNGVCKVGNDCICLPQWNGILCDQDMNSCRSQPCQNGGRCYNKKNSYKCQCVAGYRGNRCEEEINLCSSVPCANGSSCINYRTDFKCICRAGFNGRLCQNNIDDCVSNDCTNGASCLDGYNNYSCSCTPGYTGFYCNVDIDDCANQTCSHNGICKDEINNYICSCFHGFEGRNCEINIDECVLNPCQNNGTCLDGIDDYSCKCAEGWLGKNCTSNRDECAGDPCRNNGTCHDLINNYNCSCLSGFTGKDCQININDCVAKPCQHNGICIDGVDSFSCLCKPGYTGLLCEVNIDECQDSPCIYGQCKDGINQYHCNCSRGYEGHDCDIEIDECQSVPCLNNATCVDEVGNFSCACALGYQGRQCEMRIDYCMNITCLYGGVCVNTRSGYLCNCPYGYNGTVCEHTPCTWQPCRNNASCLLNNNTLRGFECDCSPLNTRYVLKYTGEFCEKDIDNCDPTNYNFDESINITENGFCGYNGRCVDHIGYHTCECEEGWTGVACQIDVDECLSYPCRNNGECRENAAGSGYECLCPSGYHGKNCETIANPCDRKPCCKGAICKYDVNSFTCLCYNGLKGPSCCSNTTWCSNDLFNVSTCSGRGKCFNLENQFNCSCYRGWTGSRCEEDINECAMNPCVNGVCRNTHGFYQCLCEDDYIGLNCDEKIDDCHNITCENKGMCIDGVHNFTCECTPGFTGRYCEKEIKATDNELPLPALKQVARTRRASNLSLIIGVSVSFIVLCTAVMLVFLRYKKHRQCRRNVVDDVRNINVLSVDASEYIMFTNPLYRMHHGKNEEVNTNSRNVSHC